MERHHPARVTHALTCHHVHTDPESAGFCAGLVAFFTAGAAFIKALNGRSSSSELIFAERRTLVQKVFR